MNRFGKDSQYFAWGLTAFCVLVGCIVFYLLLGHLSTIGGIIGSALRVLSAFIWGLVIAYVLLRLSRYFEYKLFQPLLFRLSKGRKGGSGSSGGAPRMLAITSAIAVAIASISIILRLIIPTVYESVESILLNYNTYISTLTELIERWFEDYPELSTQLESATESVSNDIAQWIRNDFLPQMGSFITNITTGVYLVFRAVMNVAIGFVVACYLLYNREGFGANMKKLLYSALGIKRAERVLSVCRFTDDAFMGFISGKVLDSLIIGCITFVCCSLLKMPYAAFVSVIIGVTNVIPVFRPFIGAIPCTLIILVVQPVKALVFVVFIIVLQQIDGNIIGPKILGSRVGISGFWVMFAIVVCGSLFGVVGMIVGVPLFVVISAGYNSLVDYGLKKRGLTTQTAQYVNMAYMDPVTGDPVPREGEKRKRSRPKRDKQPPSSQNGEE